MDSDVEPTERDAGKRSNSPTSLARPANAPQDTRPRTPRAKTGARQSGIAAAKQAGPLVGKRAVDRAANAGMVADTIERTHSAQAAKAASRSTFVKERAGTIKKAAAAAIEQGKRSGAREQLKGHFIEALDVKTYGARGRFAGKKLVPRKSATNKGYDASRVVKKKFAGAIQQKSSPAGTEKAIAQMEKIKPGSARRGTLRVPWDYVAKTRQRAAGRIRVKGMEFTSEQAGSKLDQGLGDVAKRGGKATSTARATAKGAAVGATVSVALGAVGDAGALRRREIDGRDFAENRGVDVAEGATNAVVGVAAAGVGGAVATAALGTSAGAAAAVSAGAAGTAAVTAISGMGAAGAVVGGVLGGVTVAAAAPAALGGAAAIGGGVVIGKGYKRVHKWVRVRQEGRRQLAAGGQAQVSAAELDQNGHPIEDAEIV